MAAKWSEKLWQMKTGEGRTFVLERQPQSKNRETLKQLWKNNHLRISKEDGDHSPTNPMYSIPYSRKLSREKTFANFVDLCNGTSFLCEFLGAWYATRGRIFLVHAYSRCHVSFDRSTCPCSRQPHRYQNLMVPFRLLFLLLVL